MLAVMVILLIGASGFIGKGLSAALTAAGHIVVEARRSVPEGSRAIQADLTRDLSARDWLPKLAGIDTVINAAGVLREHGEQTFERIHARGPQALFTACVESGVRRVVQISALGADTGTTEYFRSKHAADQLLATLPLEWTIVQPSIVYGPGGTSARLFAMLASLPVIGLPGSGRQQLQPIHRDDLIEAIVRIFSHPEFMRRRIPLVGPHASSLRAFLQSLRHAMGLGSARFVRVPMWLMRMAARIAELSPRSLLDRNTLVMLEMGTTADPTMTHRLLRRAPRPVAAFIEPQARDATRTVARLSWLLPTLRASVAAAWIWTGIVSLWLYPAQSSYELLARAGIGGALASVALYGAALLDLAFGAATLLFRRRRLLWLAQITVVLAYTLIITAWLPEHWLHPYGPIVKNLPMLACIYLLYALEPPRWNTS